MLRATWIFYKIESESERVYNTVWAQKNYLHIEEMKINLAKTKMEKGFWLQGARVCACVRVLKRKTREG